MQNVSYAHVTSRQVTSSKANVHYHFSFQGRGAVAQSVERPNGPSLVQLYLTDVGSNPERELSTFLLRRGVRWKEKLVVLILATPSVGERRNKSKVWEQEKTIFLSYLIL